MSSLLIWEICTFTAKTARYLRKELQRFNLYAKESCMVRLTYTYGYYVKSVFY